MRRFHFLQYDVFTNTPFGGNQLAVFPEANGLTDEEMQSIAREMNYSESTFIVPATDPQALCRVRIFTPSRELPFAGHPVIGTTFALSHAGRIRESATPIHLQLGIGTLPVELLYEERHASFVWMHQPVPTFEAWRGDRAALLDALSLTADDVVDDLPIEVGSAGVPFLYLPLRSIATASRARHGQQLAALLEPIAPNAGLFLFAPERSTLGADVHGRMFAPAMGIQEDAATGAASGPLGAYLLRHKRAQPDKDGDTRIRLEQGVEMGRPSRIEISLQSKGAEIQDVRVGGEAVMVAEGNLILP